VSTVDYLKERIGYLKLYQGIVVAADGGLIGWVLSNAHAAPIDLGAILGMLGIIALTVAGVILHIRIQYHIDQLQGP